MGMQGAHAPRTPHSILGRQSPDRLLSYEEWRSALGRTSVQPRSHRGVHGAEVPLRSISGTVARTGDFDRHFRPVRREGRRRSRELARAMGSGRGVPPVSLIRLGELHFVEDGHHRIAAAHALGAVAVDAVVRSVCTVAFGCGDCTPEHLRSKVAERLLLERVPLPDDASRDLWLGDPRDYARLAGDALAWTGNERALSAGAAERWWHERVLPVAGPAEAETGSGAARFLRALDAGRVAAAGARPPA